MEQNITQEAARQMLDALETELAYWNTEAQVFANHPSSDPNVINLERRRAAIRSAIASAKQ